MKTIIAGILMLLCTSTLAAVTNELYPSDVSAQSYPSDYGVFTLTVTDILSAPKWDGHSTPPVTIETAIQAVTKYLPPLTDDKWTLNYISLVNFDGKGWHYLVVFENRTFLTKDQLHYVVTKYYIAAVLMDGRVLAPGASPQSSIRK